jgi:hypothetical protein
MSMEATRMTGIDFAYETFAGSFNSEIGIIDITIKLNLLIISTQFPGTKATKGVGKNKRIQNRI